MTQRRSAANGGNQVVRVLKYLNCLHEIHVTASAATPLGDRPKPPQYININTALSWGGVNHCCEQQKVAHISLNANEEHLKDIKGSLAICTLRVYDILFLLFVFISNRRDLERNAKHLATFSCFSNFTSSHCHIKHHNSEPAVDLSETDVNRILLILKKKGDL